MCTHERGRVRNFSKNCRAHCAYAALSAIRELCINFDSHLVLFHSIFLARMLLAFRAFTLFFSNVIYTRTEKMFAKLPSSFKPSFVARNRASPN